MKQIFSLKLSPCLSYLLLLIFFLTLKNEISFASVSAGKKQCRGYFIQSDIFQSLDLEEQTALQQSAEIFSQASQHSHDFSKSTKTEINSQLLALARKKEFDVDQFKYFKFLFVDLVNNFSKKNQSENIDFLRQASVNQQTLQLQQQTLKKRYEAVAKILERYPIKSVTEAIDYLERKYETTDLNEAFLRSCSANQYNKRKINVIEAEILLALGADINFKNQKMESALWLATGRRSYQLIEFLLMAGADVNIRGPDNSTPLIKALSLNIILNERAQKDQALLLLKYKADPNLQNKFGQTALMNLRPGMEDFIQILLEAGADLEVRTRFGETALMHFAREKSFKIFETLLLAGANPNPAIRAGISLNPLLKAALFGEENIARLILEKAGAHAPVAEALKLAKKHNHSEVVKLIEDYMAQK